jgi:hypothetical protein
MIFTEGLVKLNTARFHKRPAFLFHPDWCRPLGLGLAPASKESHQGLAYYDTATLECIAVNIEVDDELQESDEWELVSIAVN